MQSGSVDVQGEMAVSVVAAADRHDALSQTAVGLVIRIDNTACPHLQLWRLDEEHDQSDQQTILCMYCLCTIWRCLFLGQL